VGFKGCAKATKKSAKRKNCKEKVKKEWNERGEQCEVVSWGVLSTEEGWAEGGGKKRNRAKRIHAHTLSGGGMMFALK
jgi:hypothetical protein